MPNVGAVKLNAELKIIIYKISPLLKFTEKCRNDCLSLMFFLSKLYI